MRVFAVEKRLFERTRQLYKLLGTQKTFGENHGVKHLKNEKVDKSSKMC